MKNINDPRLFYDVTSGRHLNLNDLMLNTFSINDNVIEPIEKAKVTSIKHKIKNG